MLFVDDDPIAVIPSISYEWVTGGAAARLVLITNGVLGAALILCGIWFVISVVAWVAAKMGASAGHKDSAFFLGGPAKPLKAAVLLGSLAAAMRYGTALVNHWVM